MSEPLVSIICLCHNQKPFIRETLDSAFEQTYRNTEIIIVDDGSTDGSKELIQGYLKNRTDVPFIDLQDNVGNTTAFNRGLEKVNGKYVIDLACDDVLDKNRVARQVDFFEDQSSDVGVIYSDAMFISEDGKELHRHFSNPKRISYEGDIYSKVVSTYFIPPPTMMMKKEVLDELRGYDEELAYEDFDFWVRSARNWKYGFQNELLTRIRLVRNSHSERLYQKGDKKLASTIKVCEKIFALNKTKEDTQALIHRLKYEFRHAMITGSKVEAKEFMRMLKRLQSPGAFYGFLELVNSFGWDLSWVRSLFVRRSN